MPPQTHADQDLPGQVAPDGNPAAATAEPGDRVSRRSLLRGAAGVGAVGLAATVGGAAFAAASSSAARPPAAGAAHDTARQDSASGQAGDHLVVYLRDAASGEFEVFNGTSQTRVHNPGLAAQLLNGLKTA
jgi:hypothetical protein